jgi:hypothetical protein
MPRIHPNVRRHSSGIDLGITVGSMATDAAKSMTVFGGIEVDEMKERDEPGNLPIFGLEAFRLWLSKLPDDDNFIAAIASEHGRRLAAKRKTHGHGAGRPKGQKNKPGHRAGRPKKI